MLDKFPEAFRFILVDYIDPSAYWFFNAWSVLRKFISFIFSVKLSHVVLSIKDDRDISVRKIHVTISFRMIDPQTIVIIDVISFMLIRFMGNKFENNLT